MGILALEDGTIWRGQGFGAPTERVGEVVFCTAMTGYQEVLTDPSYRGQMVVMTASQIGNTGINPEDAESDRPQVEGFVVRQLTGVTSNWRSQRTLDDYLRAFDVPGLADINTRALTLHLRTHGALRAALSSRSDADPAALLAAARAWPGLDGRDLVREATCTDMYEWREPTPPAWEYGVGVGGRGSGVGEGFPHPNHLPEGEGTGGESDTGKRTPLPSLSPWEREVVRASPHSALSTQHSALPLVVVYDFGIKRSILRRLAAHGCRVTVVPAATTATTALALRPDGVVLSNGPGDPAALPYAVAATSEVLERGLPTLGICLGHQLIGQALGGRTFKLKFGHHGGNQPVSDMATGRVRITSQNHNYAVDPDGLPSTARVTQMNLNDQTVEGLVLTDRPVWAVQYHPEAAPGPHDGDDILATFVAHLRRE